ncbi:MAG: hypothetical protein GOVbin707_43 [Prokaryotic dsDNA virus sp.]|nr:MAG: hypothetical protein GOVbin707_43 [Prokaryotic dsDNA virus sp.]|tara:strand:+ start:7477 stop:8220 length:744 start_codon:yes stop_codon:yes gene_type:complete
MEMPKYEKKVATNYSERKIDRDIMRGLRELTKQYNNKQGGMSQRNIALQVQCSPSTITYHMQKDIPNLPADLRKRLLSIPQLKEYVQTHESNLGASGITTIEVPLIGYPLDGLVIPNLRPPYVSSIPYIEGINYDNVYTMIVHARSAHKVFSDFLLVFIDTETTTDQFAGYTSTFSHITLKEDLKHPEKRLSYLGKLITYNNDTNNQSTNRFFSIVNATGKLILKDHDLTDIENINPMFGMFQKASF